MALDENGWDQVHMVRKMTPEQLEECGFAPGDVMKVQDAEAAAYPEQVKLEPDIPAQASVDSPSPIDELIQRGSSRPSLLCVKVRCAGAEQIGNASCMAGCAAVGDILELV